MHRPAFVRLSRAHFSFAALATVAALGCSDGPTGPRALPVTVSGTFLNRSGQPIPANARVVAVWAGTVGNEDVAYVFGEGTIDLAANRFSITFDRNPPASALVNNQLGVAFIALTTDPNVHEGPLPSGNAPPTSFIGATGNHAVIFLNADPGLASDWAGDFRLGYNVGQGVDLPGTFDGFQPVPLQSMVLIVDDLADIEFVNWT